MGSERFRRYQIDQFTTEADLGSWYCVVQQVKFLLFGASWIFGLAKEFSFSPLTPFDTYMGLFHTTVFINAL